MDLKSLGSKAKELIDKRGGTDSLKEDVQDLKSIAGGEGSLSDKAKAAMDAIKDPGASPDAVAETAQPVAGAPATEAADQQPPPDPQVEAPADQLADEQRRGGGRGRHGGGGRGQGRAGGQGRGGGGGGGRRGGRGG